MQFKVLVLGLILLFLLFGCIKQEEKIIPIYKQVKNQSGYEPIVELPPKRCEDGTLYKKCSLTKSFLCQDGNLVLDIIACGCEDGKTLSDEKCVFSYLTGKSKEIEFDYILRGKEGKINYKV